MTDAREEGVPTTIPIACHMSRGSGPPQILAPRTPGEICQGEMCQLFSMLPGDEVLWQGGSRRFFADQSWQSSNTGLRFWGFFQAGSSVGPPGVAGIPRCPLLSCATPV